jgi:6-phosphofructokinase 1
MVVEVMGRNTGWIAVFSGIAGGADGIVIPELELTVEEIASAVRRRHERGKRLGGIGAALAEELEQRTGYETRVTVLGHVQRGGTPTATDRVLATRYGIKAYEMARAGEFGRMAALRGSRMESVPLGDVTGVKPVDLTFLDAARRFFG